MPYKRDIRIIFLYEFKRGTNAARTTQNINDAFGENTVNASTVQRWFKKFREGNENLEDEERGRPNSVIDEEELKRVIETDPRQTVREISEVLGVSKSCVSNHLEKIGMSKNFGQWVPHELSENQKNCRYEFCYSNLLRNKNDPFLERIFAFGGKWILYENRKRREKWLDNDEEAKQIQKSHLLPKKIMITVWWTSVGLLHYEFMKPGEILNSESYCAQLEKMHLKFCQKRPILIHRKGPIFLHDNTRPYVSQMALQKLNEMKYETLLQPPHSPDLDPTDFHFFKHLDYFIKDMVFKDEQSVKSAFENFIASKDTSFYSDGINKLVSRWQKCVESDGCYF
ncbi:Histone-lysine N-methyltransferase SETMAR [Strongyloides ratti]|uniref:Histone-lysine N-methyltransferase SETMAR n=1 Tax=Strongyloides ratti TaxID=34506 RepID=A0A090MP23_STRRB|nr:Histone-lysine N-methyltransferase SETMAR [Strongyloides ratti]CEF59836.1 Histone-lysine N-methyltransferase SETMAR [Strongyloides ratti]